MSILSALGGTQEPSYANPFLNGSRGGNISGGGLGFPFMPSPNTISKLREFGVNFPEIQQNPLISNATAQAHPLMKLLSGAIMGGALTPGPAPIEGAGQGFSRAMQGILGVPQYKRQFQAAQIQAPFQMADMVAGLRATQGEETLRKQYGNMLEAQAAGFKDRSVDKTQHEADALEIARLRASGRSVTPDVDPATGEIRGFHSINTSLSPTDPGYIQYIPRETIPGMPAGVAPAGKGVGSQRAYRGLSDNEVIGIAKGAIAPPPGITREGAIALLSGKVDLAGGRAGAIQAATEKGKAHDTWVTSQRKMIAEDTTKLGKAAHRLDVIDRINANNPPDRQITPEMFDEKTGRPSIAAPSWVGKYIDDVVATDVRMRSRHNAQWEQQVKADPAFEQDFNAYDLEQHAGYAANPQAAAMAYGVPEHAINKTASSAPTGSVVTDPAAAAYLKKNGL